MRGTYGSARLAIFALFCLVSACIAQTADNEWQDLVQFRLPEDASTRAKVNRSADWLRQHTVRVLWREAEAPIPVVAWKDPTLEPDKPALLAGYLITDTLWAAKALKPIDAKVAAEMENGLRRMGWYGNGLQDVLFHRLEKVRHRPVDVDFVHGHSLGRYTSTDGRLIDVRVFQQQWDAYYSVGHPRLFAEHAVYQALWDFWQDRRVEARRRIKEILTTQRTTDPENIVFWDAQSGVLVDYVNYREWLAFTKDQTQSFRHYTFKLGVLLYAIRLFNMESEAPMSRFRDRLWSGQSATGGVAHFVDVARDGNVTVKSEPTGEASAIAILAETVVPLAN
jgi:hypothetical protein